LTRVAVALCWLLTLGLLAVGQASGQSDAVTVGTVSATAGSAVDVPVYIRDVSGTPLGIDQPPGSRIQSYSIKIDYAPAASVQSVTFTRAGITAPLTPTFESSPSAPGTISLLDTFQEATNLIPFTLNAPAPGNQVAVLHVTISPAAAGGSPITLTLDSTFTQLTDQAGSPATRESTATSRLTLVNGVINVTASADVSMTKSLTTAGPYVGGQSIAYTLLVTNAGPSTATSIQVTDTPTNLTITGVSGGGCSALPCTIAGLAPGASVTINVTATINAAGAFDNSATATAAEPDPNAANNTDSAGNGGAAGPAPVPTLGGYAMMLLGLILAGAGALALRRPPAGELG
jgi:uncharacterized repeat protein (TIGR01451 family)